MTCSFTMRAAALAALSACNIGPDPATRAGAAVAAHEPAPPSDCLLDAPSSPFQHVIYVQFDNVHFRRDNPNVPSDLEQMPHLLDFITEGGTLRSEHHTPLISHTANNLLTSLTGVYGDRHGQPISNSFAVFTPDGRGVAAFNSFAYWTNIVSPAIDPRPTMIASDGKIAPAPWVPFARAGCNVGAVAMANLVLENATADVVNVFGPASPEAAEARADPARAAADFVGVAVHCAADREPCGSTSGGRPDLLPDEPGGYVGFNALYGHRSVAPQISPDGPLTDLDGAILADAAGHVGFPGFGLGAAQTLAYVAAMQEHGVPVTFAYISDAHDDRTTGLALGPGEPAYVAQLAAYDRAWAEFFARLARAGITRDNTLFVFTADENDHFVGGPPSPADCDGIRTPCSYAQLGELQVNVTELVRSIDPALAAIPFALLPGMAPPFYLQGAPPPGTAAARALERAAARFTATSPLDGRTHTLTAALADPIEMKLLHMVTSDPQRTPTFLLFGDPDFVFVRAGITGVVETRAAAWNHGGIQPDITTTWLGLVGPGVRRKGIARDTFSDHTDIRPTILLLAGLTDDYIHDGVALVDDLHVRALPPTLREGAPVFRARAHAYKQIAAPLGELGRHTLAVSTAALAGDDATYTALEASLAAISEQRDALAAQMIAWLDGAEFHARPLRDCDARPLIDQADQLLAQVRALSR